MNYDWSMVFKTTTNQSYVTLIRSNYPRNGYAESLHPFSLQFLEQGMTQLLLDERQRLKSSNIVVVQFLTERKKVKKNCLILKPTTTAMLSTLNFTGLTLLRPLVFWQHIHLNHYDRSKKYRDLFNGCDQMKTYLQFTTIRRWFFLSYLCLE